MTAQTPQIRQRWKECEEEKPPPGVEISDSDGVIKLRPDLLQVAKKIYNDILPFGEVGTDLVEIELRLIKMGYKVTVSQLSYILDFLKQEGYLKEKIRYTKWGKEWKED